MDTTAESSLLSTGRLSQPPNGVDDWKEFAIQENKNTLYVRDLDSTKQEIRLLQFEPDQKRNGPVRLITWYLSLDEAKDKYEALSYTWNNAIPKRSRIPSTGPRKIGSIQTLRFLSTPKNLK
jgi:hypothetical protein